MWITQVLHILPKSLQENGEDFPLFTQKGPKYLRVPQSPWRTSVSAAASLLEEQSLEEGPGPPQPGTEEQTPAGK